MDFDTFWSLVTKNVTKNVTKHDFDEKVDINVDKMDKKSRIWQMLKCHDMIHDFDLSLKNYQIP